MNEDLADVIQLIHLLDIAELSTVIVIAGSRIKDLSKKFYFMSDKSDEMSPLQSTEKSTIPI